MMKSMCLSDMIICIQNALGSLNNESVPCLFSKYSIFRITQRSMLLWILKKDFVYRNNKDFIKDEWCKVYILKDWAQL